MVIRILGQIIKVMLPIATSPDIFQALEAFYRAIIHFKFSIVGKLMIDGLKFLVIAIVECILETLLQ